MDSGAARTTLPSTSGLSNIQRLDNGIKLEYANGDKGSTVAEEGTLLLNGRELRALVSDDLHDGLLSTGQMDKELNAATIQTDGRSISFVPDERQEQILDMLFREMNPNNIIAEAELNDDGLYEVKVSRDSAKALSVSVFPRVAANSLSQAVYLLHASLSHIHKAAMIDLAKSALEEQHNTDSLSPMVLNWPPAMTPNVIRNHFPQCKACLMAYQKKLSFFTSYSRQPTRLRSTTLPDTMITATGQLGQVDMWGPYHVGRTGCTHIFTVIDAYSQYAVSIPCSNKSGEIPKLLKQVIGICLSIGVKFEMIVGDSAFNTTTCKHVLHTAYGDSRGIKFSLAVPEEHETCGIIERFFSSVQLRASANLLAFLEDDPTLIEFIGLDAMVYATKSLNWTPRAKFDHRSSPASIIKLPPLDFHKTLLLPFGIPAVAHQRKVRSKLHGHGTEAIFIGPSENSSHRSGMFLNRSTREIIIRRSFNVWNEKPFYNFLVSDDSTPMVQFEESLETTESTDVSDPTLPDLIDDSDDEDVSENGSVNDSDLITSLEDDANEYQWTSVRTSSLSKSKQKLVK